MTKIKNTKKGMAKKTLSMSLVVAMLATSNVPVWAAEFSDGTEAAAVTYEAEAFSADEADVPVVEDAESDDIAAATAALQVETGLKISGANGANVKVGALKSVTASITNEAIIQQLSNTEPGKSESGSFKGVELTWSVSGTDATATSKLWKKNTFVKIPDNIKTAATVDKTITVSAKVVTATYTDGTLDTASKVENPAETKTIKVIGNSLSDYYAKGTKLTFKALKAKAENELQLNEITANYGATVTYEWFVDGEKIKDANGIKYTPTVDMIGKTITAQAIITHETDFPGEEVRVSTEEGLVVEDGRTPAAALTKDNYASSSYNIEWDMTGSEIKTWPEYTYTGDEFTPSIKKIKKGNKEFDSSDYQLSWESNKNAGTAALVVTFTADAMRKDNSIPKKLRIEFTIKQADFTKAEVTVSKTPSYATDVDEKEAVRNAGLTVKLGDKILTEWDSKLNPDGKYEIDTINTDLTKPGTKPGTKTGKIVIKPHDANNNYAGTVILTTDVARKDINELYIDPIEDKSFTGQEIKLDLKVKYSKDASSYINKPNNYEVTYSDNILPGTATAHVKGINNYTGTRDITFNIKAADNSLETALKGLITNDGRHTTVDYTGSDIDYVKSAYVDGGKLYAINRDFTVEYLTQHKNAGNCRVKVSGAGVYAGQSFIVDFKILPKSMTGFTQNTDAAFGREITIADLTYDPETASYKPEVTITYNGTTLTKDVDYEVEYGVANLTTKTVPVTITGKGNFKDSPSNITGKIIAKDIKKVTFSEIAQQKYTGSAITAGKNTFTIKAKDGNTDLKEGTDFHVVKYNNNTKSGVATITIAGLGNYQGETTLTFLIVDREYTASIVRVDKTASDGTGSTLLPSKVYNRKDANGTVAGIKGITLIDGKEFKVVDNSTGELILNTKYKVTYENNTAAGTATIKVEGIDGNKISAINTFEIKPTKLPDTLSISDIANQIYTGSEIKPDVKITAKDGDYKLVEGTDYEVSYEKNTDVGTAKVVVTGKGNYAELDADKAVNHKDQTFNIIRASISRSEIALNDVAYAGGIEVTPALKIVNPVSGKELVKGTDYTITLKDGVNVGVATVTIKLTDNAKKNYDLANGTTEETATFHIIKKSLADCDVTVKKEKDGTLTTTVMNGVVKEASEKFETKDNGDGTATVSVVDGGKNYTGSATVEINDSETKVGTPMISNVVVKGNTVTPVLSSEVDGAVGYDYVISTEEDYKNGRVGVSKNILATNTDFHYVQKGTYYAYCHAWKRGADGKKVFGEWSNIKKFTVKATTPSTPKITKVTVKGNTVTVTYTKSSNATGYDVILGSAVKSVNGEKRPVDYGTLVKKNIKGNVVTATFKNVPAGKYYAGVHSFNKTSEDGKKVFSKWSNSKAVTVK